MKTKLFLYAAAIVFSFAFIGCKGGNTPDDPQNPEETVDAKLLGRNSNKWEIELADGTRLYLVLKRDYTDTPEYLALSCAGSYYLNHSQEKEMQAKYSYKGKLVVPARIKLDMGNGKRETHIIEGVDKIGMFSENELTEVSLPSTIKVIREQAFRDCEKLEKINIPEGVTDLEWVFGNCSSLKYVELPQSLIKMNETFRGCTALAELVIPSRVQRCWHIVSGCSSLRALVIPESVESIGDFSDCYNLKNVTCYAINPPYALYSETTLGFDELDFDLYVPEESVNKYKADKAWMSYARGKIYPIGSNLSDYPNAQDKALIGTWQLTKNDTYYENYDCYRDNHILIHIEKKYDGTIQKELYTWKVDGNELITTDANGNVDTDIYTVTENTLIKQKGVRTYKRCSDSEVEPYLSEDDIVTPDTPSTDCSNIQASYLPTGASGLGEMKEQLVSGAQSWFYDAKYGARVSKSNTEAWLYTPVYDMSDKASVQVSFQHAINYAGDMATQQTMWVTDNFTGDVTTTNWQQITIPNYPAGNNWTFVSNTVNIPIQYVGEKTVIAFKYTSGNNTSTATWEIKNLTIEAVCANN